MMLSFVGVCAAEARNIEVMFLMVGKQWEKYLTQADLEERAQAELLGSLD